MTSIVVPDYILFFIAAACVLSVVADALKLILLLLKKRLDRLEREARKRASETKSQ